MHEHFDAFKNKYLDNFFFRSGISFNIMKPFFHEVNGFEVIQGFS